MFTSHLHFRSTLKQHCSFLHFLCRFSNNPIGNFRLRNFTAILCMHAYKFSNNIHIINIIVTSLNLHIYY